MWVKFYWGSNGERCGPSIYYVPHFYFSIPQQLTASHHVQFPLELYLGGQILRLDPGHPQVYGMFLTVFGTNNNVMAGVLFCGMMLRAVAVYSQSPGAGISICGPCAAY